MSGDLTTLIAEALADVEATKPAGVPQHCGEGEVCEACASEAARRAKEMFRARSRCVADVPRLAAALAAQMKRAEEAERERESIEARYVTKCEIARRAIDETHDARAERDAARNGAVMLRAVVEALPRCQRCPAIATVADLGPDGASSYHCDVCAPLEIAEWDRHRAETKQKHDVDIDPLVLADLDYAGPLRALSLKEAT